MKPVHLYATQCILAEGPYWHARRKSFFWVDIEKGTLFEYSLLSGKIKTWNFKHRLSLALESKETDHMVLALDLKIARFNLKTEELEWLATVEEGLPLNRCNDGKCDAKGRLWVGTMSRMFTAGAGSLYSIDRNFKVQQHLDRITISNGMAWSENNKTLYYIDSPTQRVKAFHFDLENGQLRFDRTVIEIPIEMGTPDGMCIDVEGKLWVAHYGGFGVYRWDPETGKLMEKIELPVPNITCCTFGGENLDTLLITTARENLTDSQIAEYPLSGDVFLLRTNTKGALPNPCCF
jgi:sugar lactone lactonase YvrE